MLKKIIKIFIVLDILCIIIGTSFDYPVSSIPLIALIPLLIIGIVLVLISFKKRIELGKIFNVLCVIILIQIILMFFIGLIGFTMSKAYENSVNNFNQTFFK